MKTTFYFSAFLFCVLSHLPGRAADYAVPGDYPDLETLRAANIVWADGDTLTLDVETDATLTAPLLFNASATLRGRGHVTPSRGSAIRFATAADGTTLTLLATGALSFSGFTAGSGNGGVILADTLVLGGPGAAGELLFSGNTAANGGALHAAHLTITNTAATFLGNRAGSLGGAIHAGVNATLLATGADLLFRGNTSGLATPDALHCAGTTGTLILAAGDGHSIFFHDPLTTHADPPAPLLPIHLNPAPFSGTLLLSGDNPVRADTILHAGTLRLAPGAGYGHADGSFAALPGATLAVQTAPGHPAATLAGSINLGQAILAFDLTHAQPDTFCLDLAAATHVNPDGIAAIDILAFGPPGATNLIHRPLLPWGALPPLTVCNLPIHETRAAGTILHADDTRLFLANPPPLHTLRWNNAAGNGLWDLTSANWELPHDPGAAPLTFLPGDAALLDTTRLPGGSLTLPATGLAIGPQPGNPGLHISGGHWILHGGALEGGGILVDADATFSPAGLNGTTSRRLSQRITVNAANLTLLAPDGHTLLLSGHDTTHLPGADGGAITLRAASHLFLGAHDSAGTLLFADNKALWGAAINIPNTSASITLLGGTNCFLRNTAVMGGAIHNYTGFGSLAFLGGHNTFSRNTASNNGGAVCFNQEILFAAGSNAFTHNTAPFGGAICGSQNVLMQGGGNTFLHNTAASDGGAIHCRNPRFTAGQATFLHNTANRYGGAICAFNATDLVAADATLLFQGNTDTTGPSALYIENRYHNQTLTLAAIPPHSLLLHDAIRSNPANPTLTTRLNPDPAHTGTILLSGPHASELHSTTTLHHGTLHLSRTASLAISGTANSRPHTLSVTDTATLLTTHGATLGSSAALNLAQGATLAFDLPLLGPGLTLHGNPLNLAAGARLNPTLTIANPTNPPTPGTLTLITAPGAFTALDPSLTPPHFLLPPGTRIGSFLTATADHLLLSPPAPFANTTLAWTAATDATFNTPGNWRDPLHPHVTHFTPGDAILIDIPSAITIPATQHIAHATLSAASISLNGGTLSTFAPTTLDSPRSLTLTNAASATLDNTTLLLQGPLRILGHSTFIQNSGTLSASALLIDNATATLGDSAAILGPLATTNATLALVPGSGIHVQSFLPGPHTTLQPAAPLVHGTHTLITSASPITADPAGLTLLLPPTPPAFLANLHLSPDATALLLTLRQIVPLTLDPSGGHIPTNHLDAILHQPYPPLPVPVRTGYDFIAWLLPDGTPVDSATPLTLSSPHTLTALWDSSPLPGHCGLPSGEPINLPATYDAYLYAPDPCFDPATSTTGQLHSVRGLLTLTLTRTGRLTARLSTPSGRHSFFGKAWSGHTPDGIPYATLAHRTGWTLTLFLNQGRLWGTATAPDGDTHSFDGLRRRFPDRSDTAAQTLLANHARYYTAAILPPDDPLAPPSPSGGGYLTLNVNKRTGSTRVSGRLPDGTPVSLSHHLLPYTSCGDSPALPLFARLQSGRGSLGALLWFTATSNRVTLATDTDAAWVLRWHHPKTGAIHHTHVTGLDYTPGAVPLNPGGYLLLANPGQIPYYESRATTPSGFLRFDALTNGIPATPGPRGTSLLLPHGTRPVPPDFSAPNSARATLHLNLRTGIYSGSFHAYAETPRLRGLRATYSAILLQDTGGLLLPATGHALLTPTEPAAKQLRLKHSLPVWLQPR